MIGMILRRELSDLRSQRAMVVMIFVFGVLLPVAAAWYLGSALTADSTLDESIYMWRAVAVLMCFMPSFLPAALSATNLAGEFEMRTLVPLLATPISNRALFLGKMFSILLPALSVVLLSQMIFYIATHNVEQLTDGASWRFYAILATATIGYYFLVVAIGFMVAYKVREIRNSQQYGALIMMPIMLGSMVGLGYSVVKLNLDHILYVTLPLCIIIVILAITLVPTLWNRSKLAERF
ncbi:ABC transporter permease [Paenibacillus pini]|uniref:ABC transporter permease protein n=1 Tax=Paenibacillus pini JCM 16418 TaxID=1236976 RepID=W7Z091_9BACL|nr:ABC transporter permease [Paenibacillus pini]GAF10366.1 ABC transporter permease protein [Paenibacillus pini JCM 16418]